MLAASVLTLAPIARGGPIPAAPLNPAVPDHIVFDGASLVWVSASGRTSYAAFSGRADGAATEATVDDGPVPQGKFTVDPANIQDLSSQPADVIREWGTARVPLQLRQSTRRRMIDGLEVDRRGFHIHGGTEMGTKGSIELNDVAVHRSFFDRLRAHGKPIDVEVLYSGVWEQRFELPSCRYPAPVTEPVNSSDVDDPTYALWKFSSEVNCRPPGKGACLYRVKGTRFDMDVNVFFGTVDDLRARWPFRVE